MNNSNTVIVLSLQLVDQSMVMAGVSIPVKKNHTFAVYTHTKGNYPNYREQYNNIIYIYLKLWSTYCIYLYLSAASKAWFMAPTNSLFSLFSPRSMRITTHLSFLSTLIPLNSKLELLPAATSWSPLLVVWLTTRGNLCFANLHWAPGRRHWSWRNADQPTWEQER